MARSPTGESVVTRVVRLLEAFDDHHRRLTVADLADRAGLPVGTAHRIVGQLVSAGLLERGDHGEVHLGIRVWELAALAPGCPDLRGAAAGVLAGLAAATGEHATVMVLDGRDVVYADHVAGPHALPGLALRAGRRVPAHAVAGGLLLLAHAPAPVRDELLHAALARYTAATPVDPADLDERFRRARSLGWVVGDGLVDPAALAVAVPVRGPDGQVVAAVAVVAGRDSARPMALVPVLRRAATRIESGLRRAGPPARTPVRRVGLPAGRPAAPRRRIPAADRGLPFGDLPFGDVPFGDAADAR